MRITSLGLSFLSPNAPDSPDVLATVLLCCQLDVTALPTVIFFFLNLIRKGKFKLLVGLGVYFDLGLVLMGVTVKLQGFFLVFMRTVELHQKERHHHATNSSRFHVNDLFNTMSLLPIVNRKRLVTSHFASVASNAMERLCKGLKKLQNEIFFI